jgi:MoaA/NifB/PqqE/SkfB family radical SAM enzyme
MMPAMLTEEAHAAGVADKVRGHEEAAHEKRNWVRLTYDCNNRCVFCLDSDTHDGEMRDREDVKRQILDGRRKGAERLILSGGEPTMHPDYVAFIKLGALAGYRKIQTVTNGRMFMYEPFLKRCLDAGLSEITFSLHGPNARIHDALVGVKGAFDEEVRGLENAFADGRPIINVDVVINRGNVKQLPEMLRTFYDKGVREFDLLQVVPFGRAYTEGRDTLFYDLEAMQPYLREALEFSRRPDVHVWMNRFPPKHLEGFEHLIQDPYKLNDEVRGRKEEFARLLDEGVALDCRDPGRCRYCYLEQLCDTLDDVRATVAAQRFEVARVDTAWEAQQAPVFGGDPASARRARPDGRVGLPLASGPEPRTTPTPAELVTASGASTLRLVAPDLAAARAALAGFPGPTELELELDDYAGLDASLVADGTLDGRHLARVVARRSDDARALLTLSADFEVQVAINTETAGWLRTLRDAPSRLSLNLPTYERLTESQANDVDLRGFFAEFPYPVPVEGVPACVLGRAPRAERPTLDTAMMDASGRLEIFRYTQRYILAHYRTKSLRCGSCVHAATCTGMHVNYVRAHGYGLMQPVTAASAAAE